MKTDGKSSRLRKQCCEDKGVGTEKITQTIKTPRVSRSFTQGHRQLEPEVVTLQATFHFGKLFNSLSRNNK